MSRPAKTDFTISEQLKIAREQKKYSQADLAALVGIKQQTLATYERGTVLPTLPVLCRLADTLGVTTDFLLGVDSKAANNGLSNAANANLQLLSIQKPNDFKCFDELLSSPLLGTLISHTATACRTNKAMNIRINGDSIFTDSQIEEMTPKLIDYLIDEAGEVYARLIREERKKNNAND